MSMQIDIRVTVGDDVREYSFARRRISVGQGPFNDVVVDCDALGLVFGALEIDPDSNANPVLIREKGGPETCLRRDGESLHHVTEEQPSEWTVQVGDIVQVGADAELEIEVLDIVYDDEPDWFSIALRAPGEVNIAVESARFLASASRDIAAADGLEPVLHAIANLVYRRTEWLPHHVEFSVPVEQRPWRSDQFGLRKTRLGDDGIRGTFFEDRRALPPLADHASESLEVLRSLDQAVYDRPSGGRTNVYVPITIDDELAAVLDMSFDDELDESGVRDVVDAAQLLTPHAAQVVRAVRLGKRQADLAEENRYFRERQRRHYLFKDLIAESSAMREVYEKVNDWVEVEDPVLILGEAGTGKSLIARALHHLGERRDGMLTSLNCGELEGELLDVELFGCVASDLAGDVAARKGVFELATHGTVFLEEIDQLSLLLQGKVLRMLREGEVRRIGDAVARHVGTRLIASSHRDLCRLVEAGKFRRDLWMALKGQALRVPPLRERREDILPLARTFLSQFAERYGRDCVTLDGDVEDKLLEHPWHGNVRELQTVVEAATLNCGEAHELTPEHFVL